MSRSRPTSNPLSYHKHTGQYYVTRAGKRIYLGADRDEALEKYHRMSLGLVTPEKPSRQIPLTAKELANRFLSAQQANWRNLVGEKQPPCPEPRRRSGQCEP